MNDARIKRTVRTMIEQLLIEGETDNKKKKKSRKKAPPGLRIATGALGSGRFKRMVAEAGARVEKDPKGLMKDLGIKGSSGGTDLDKALSVIRSAIYTNLTMGEAYTGASYSQEQSQEGEPVKVVAIYPSGLNTRNAIKFMSHTLQAAINAGMLGLTGGIELNSGKSSPIILYQV